MNYKARKEAAEHVNSPTCKVLEYETGDVDINIAVVSISGRYPESGSVSNQKVKELVYVSSGSGKVTVDGVTTDVFKGDVVLIKPAERFYWQGELELSVACAPAWNPAQYSHHT